MKKNEVIRKCARHSPLSKKQKRRTEPVCIHLENGWFERMTARSDHQRPQLSETINELKLKIRFLLYSCWLLVAWSWTRREGTHRI